MGRRRRKKKSILPALIVLLVLVLVCAVLWKFVFIVRNVDVSGNGNTLSTEEVIRAARVNFGASIFGVDTDKIAENINGTGVVRADGIIVEYPDSLKISVAPRKSVAMVLHLGRIHVLDENGCEIASMNDVPDEDLIYISGMRVSGCGAGKPIQADGDQLEAYCAVMQAILSNAATPYVSELNLENTMDIRIITRTGIRVELGDWQNARDKIAWMKSAVNDLENRGQMNGTLDVRSGNKADYRPAY